MIEERKRMHPASTLNCVMCEKQVRRRRTGHLESASFEQKFFASCQNSVRHFAVEKIQNGRRRRNATRASYASASLQRVKGFPVATNARSGRAQCHVEKTIVKATAGTEEGRKECGPPQRVQRLEDLANLPHAGDRGLRA